MLWLSLSFGGAGAWCVLRILQCPAHRGKFKSKEIRLVPSKEEEEEEDDDDDEEQQ